MFYQMYAVFGLKNQVELRARIQLLAGCIPKPTLGEGMVEDMITLTFLGSLRYMARN